jgi:hypothetical protein
MPDEQGTPPPPPQLPPAGWYPDPDHPESTQRYWDGERWTDSYAPIGTPIVDPQDPPRPLATLQAVAVAGLTLVAVVAALRVYADARYIAVLEDRIDGVAPDPGEVDDAESLADVTGVVIAAALYVIGPAVFLPWFYVAYVNLRRFGLRNLRYSSGWAIGSWFIPIFNLFRPKQIANDLSRGTSGGTLHSTGRIDTHPVSPLLHWWWAFYLLSSIVTVFGSSSVSDEDFFESDAPLFDSLSDERAFYVGDLISSAVAIAAAVLAIMVIRQITRDQQEVMEKPAATLHTYVTPPPDAGS